MEIMLFAAIGDACLQHAFAEATLFEKVFFKPQESLIYKIIRLMNEANCYVRSGFWRSGLYELAVKFISLRNFASEPPDVECLF